MRLGRQWNSLQIAGSDARIRLTLEEPERIDRAAQLLGPVQPVRSGPDALTFNVVGRSGAVKRLLERIDDERIHGNLEVIASDPVPVVTSAPVKTLTQSWDEALATLPADWSDLFAEVELSSSDYVDRFAVNTVPMNPRRDHERLVFRFRSARKFGYGAAPQMVRRCFERCDADVIRGSVRVLRVLSDTRPVATQGPVWLFEGRTV